MSIETNGREFTVSCFLFDQIAKHSLYSQTKTVDWEYELNKFNGEGTLPITPQELFDSIMTIVESWKNEGGRLYESHLGIAEGIRNHFTERGINL
jgi:hypothetical protein